MFQIVIFSLVYLTVPTTAHAVDGYKKLKFGMSAEEVKTNADCPVQVMDEKTMACANFQFNGKSTMAVFHFSSNKLGAVGIKAGSSQGEFLDIVKGLAKKYGPTEKPNFAKQVDAYMSHNAKILHFTSGDPNIGAYINREPSGEEEITVTYQSDEYVRYLEKSIDNDKATLEKDI